VGACFAAQGCGAAHYFAEKAHTDGYDRAGLLAHITGAFEDSKDLTEVSLFNNALMLMAAGTETTGLALANLLAALFRTPEYEELLRGDPTSISSVVQESLRLDPPLHMIMRITAADVIVRDVLIPAGSVVHLCLASANRDEDYFEEPDVWRLDRRSPPALTFARGKHACLGSALALLELEVALRTLHEETTAIHFAGEEVPQPSGRAFRGVRHLPVVLEHRDG
jgi:cytochrome P450